MTKEQLTEASGTPNPTDTSVDKEAIKEQVICAIQTVFDPEIPINIWELGLIYNVDVNDEGDVHVDMTLTAPACPVAGTLPGEVENRIRMVKEAKTVHVELVWDPPWTQDRMSEEAQLELGIL